MRSSVIRTRGWVTVVAVFACATLSAYFAEIASATRLPYAFSVHKPFWGIGEASEANKAHIREIAARLGILPDTRPMVQVMAEMRARGQDVVPATQLSVVTQAHANAVSTDAIGDELLPLGGISKRTTLLCNQSGQYVSYRSDEHGFRNPRGIWRVRRFDLAVLGQSFAQGYCVEDGTSFVDLLRSDYPATVNLGWSGQSALLQLAALKEYLPQRAPRIVLWTFQEGLDLGDLRRQASMPIARRYLEPAFTQRLLQRQAEIDTVLQRFAIGVATNDRAPASGTFSITETVLPVLKLWHIRERLDASFAVDDARELALLERSGFEPLRSILQQARDATAAWGGQLYFVYLPSWSRYRHDAQATDLQRLTVLRLAESLDIPVVDVHLAFQRESDTLSLFPFRVFGHYNAEGNRVVAAAISQALSRGRATSSASPRRKKDTPQ